MAAELNISHGSDKSSLFSSRNMASTTNPNNDSDADQPGSAKANELTEPTTEEKIRAFNSIVSILAQIQEDPPFKDDELVNMHPPDEEEQIRLKFSNALTHLAVANNDVVAATWHSVNQLTMTRLSDLSSDDQDTGIREKICWLFACNTPNDAIRPGSKYQGPRIVKATQPTGYPTGSGSSKENLLRYLRDLPNNW